MHRNLLAVATMLIAAFATHTASAAPSFDCAKVTSAVNKLICASPELSALDAKLAKDFDNTKFQGGIDAKALRAEEDAWLKNVRNACADAACLKSTYEARDTALLDESERAASPARYDETRPFPTDPARLADARSLIGKSCANMLGDGGWKLPGYATPKGFLSVLLNGDVVLPLEKGGARFAFLIEGQASPSCKIADVVALPDAAHADAFLACSIADMDSYGFGMRLAGHKDVVGYWTVMDGRLMRQPIGVLGGNMHCQEPENGE
ncbi:MAG TPA: hypothetical protein VN932_11700 [Rhizomicrobium sp.]|nr:hypothetical protein [Rhizomicrobium sp.]